MIKKSLLFILLTTSTLMTWGCKKAAPSPVANIATPQENIEQVVENVKSNTESVNSFISKDGKVSFDFKGDWICKEVIYGVRVDCYPEERCIEEYDADFDEMTVLYANISLIINHCEATSVSDFKLSGRSLRFIKKYGGCNSLVLIDDLKIDTEEKLDEIIMDSL